jgi:signal transduction histidine kinase
MVFGSVRARTTAVAVIVVGLAVSASALLLVTVMRRELIDELRAKALLRAQVVASTLEAGTAPTRLSLGHEDETFVQVVDDDRNVLAASPSLHDSPPVAADIESDGEIISGAGFGDPEDRFMVVEKSAETPLGPLYVLVGWSLDPVTASTSLATRLLAVTGPGLVLIAGTMTWLLAGRALSHVESIRAEVADISGSDLHRRVPESAGGDEIARLARTMNEMLVRLEQSHRQRELFVADASHELRNPIAAIRHHAEVAMAHPDQTSLDELARDVLDEDLRLHRIAEDLLLLARIDAQVTHRDRIEVDLDDVVLDEARRLKRTSPGLQIDTSDVSAARVSGDPEALARMIRNLADNASRHATSKVSFMLRESGSDVVVEVGDDGGGVAPKDRSEIFERFTRLGEARDRASGGAGLGLAIVSAVVGAHGGSVSVADGPLGGAHFAVVLPKS